MSDWSAQFQANAAILAKLGISVGVAAWAIRWKLEADRPLDRRTRLARLSMILFCWIVASLPANPGLATGLPRALIAAVGYALLWWPNSALWVARQLWKRDFGHVEAVLGSWNPIGVVVTDGPSVYQPYVGQILDELERGADVTALSRRLAAMRAEWVRDSDSVGDHRVAEELATWWRYKKAARAA